jgi:hypothetical protein
MNQFSVMKFVETGLARLRYLPEFCDSHRGVGHWNSLRLFVLLAALTAAACRG